MQKVKHLSKYDCHSCTAARFRPIHFFRNANASRKHAASTNLIVFLATIFVLTLGLSSCEDNGPSRWEAEAAINKTTELLGVHVDVKDIKCDQTGNDAYNCRVLIDYGVNLPGIGSQLPANYRFTRLGGEWTATEMHD